MKKIAAALLLLVLLLAGCGQAPETSDKENTLTLREFDAVIERWEGSVLTVTTPDGRSRSLNTLRAVVYGRYQPEPGCPVTVAVAEEGPPDAAFRVHILGLPPDRVLARQLLADMSREEKVGQIFLARCPDQQAVETVSLLHLGGYVLFARDFDGLTTEQVSSRIDSYQQAAELPLFVAVDEEGGYVVRVSSNPALRYAPFASPRNVYLSGGLEALTADAREKGRLLSSLGINVDLAPVADVSTSPSDFIYDRALGENAETTAAAVAAQVEALEETGVSATLKHFPGYGNNGDTHNGVVTDNRPAQTFYEQDLLPFASGIAAGADFVLVSHNLVTAFDGSRPASLSPAIHQLLREELGFDGLIVTDDLAMGGVAQLYGVDETAVLALLAGNDLLLSSDPEQQIAAILRAMDTGRVSESLVDETVERILRAKIMAGLIPLPDGGTAAGEEADAAGAG